MVTATGRWPGQSKLLPGERVGGNRLLRGLGAGWQERTACQQGGAEPEADSGPERAFQKRFIRVSLTAPQVRLHLLIVEAAPLIIVHQSEVGLAAVEGHFLAAVGVELERMGGVRLLPAAGLDAAAGKQISLPALTRTWTSWTSWESPA